MRILITESQLNLIMESDGYDAVLVGGLDYRSSDYPISQQVEILKKGFGTEKNVKGFRYNTPTQEVLKFLNDNPNIPVFLFSAGCTKAYDLSKSSNVDKSKLYIIEPYASSEKTKNIVSLAVANGVPSKNVFTGNSTGRGKGIVDGATNTTSGSHWGSLTEVGSLKGSSVSSTNKETKPTDKPDTTEFKISYEFNSKVADLQRKLKELKYDLGTFGPNKDGIDGKYGPLTKAAHLAMKKGLKPSEFENNKEKIVNKIVSKQGGKNIIIGDSQTPYVDMNTSKASRLSNKPGMSSLWEGGKTVSWLIEALSQFQESPEISNVVIVIGTNGGFGKFSSDNIPMLFKLLRKKFPNANFYVVQGSWGWGGLKKIQEKDVRDYYRKYASEGATIIEPPIGNVEPHGNKPIYKEIGSAIDSLL